MSLVDVLMVIVLVALAASALMTLSGRLAQQSAEAARTRQALALAESLLAEVRHMPFTYCDPGDANARTATAAVVGGAGGCATTVDGLGAEPGETRYAAASRFDGVTDYRGFTMPATPGCPGLCNLAGAPIDTPGSTLAGCRASVTLAAQAITAAPPALSIPALDAAGTPQVLRISVSVDCPGQQPVVVEGWRVRHAPNWF